MRARTLAVLHLFLAVTILVGFAAHSFAAGAPVAQVYLANGKAGLRAEGAASERPLARGTVLGANDRIVLDPGAEIGIYYRDGGRKIVRGGTRGVSGSVASFAPAVEPYRGQAVSFGATRGGEGTESGEASDTFGCWPDEIPVVASMPLITLSLGGTPRDTPVIAQATLRVLCGETSIAIASIEFPAPGKTLRLEIPGATMGEEYTLQVMLAPVAGEPFTHTARFYVAAPMTEPGAHPSAHSDVGSSGGALDDLLTPFFYCHGKVDVSFGATVRTMRFERELGDFAGVPQFSTVVTPVFGP
jgi:hypothetical protein